MGGGGAIVTLIRNYLVNYPDQFRRVFVINGKIYSTAFKNELPDNWPIIVRMVNLTKPSAPSMFPWLFGFIKPLLPQNDVPKIKIFGNSKKEWMSSLLGEIDEDQFPSYYGGTMIDPNGDPKCPSKVM